jgi:ornithine--oxo-acid transaminase
MEQRVASVGRFREVRVIAAAAGLGAPDPRCAEGPEHLLAGGLVERIARRGHVAVRGATIRAQVMRGRSRLAMHRGLCAELAQETAAAVKRGALPFVLGGDHSCAVGTWRGVAEALGGALGLIWIDAHLDSHTLGTSPSGMLHGMPLAELLGVADGHQGGATPAAVSPRNVCVIGARSFEPEEAALLAELGVRVIGMDNIEAHGLDHAFAEALEIATSGTGGYGITLDLDALDAADAPGVNLSAGGSGLGLAALRKVLAERGLDPRLAALEIVEFNPHRDRDGRTERAVAGLVDAVFGAAVPSAVERERFFCAHNYDPLPAVLVRGSGSQVWDDVGRCYIDMMSAYSAVSHGHSHPRLVAALVRQASTLAVTSRAFYSERLPAFIERLCELTEMDMALPANTGLEAVEAALKVARKWAYEVKRVPDDRAEIIACEGNFHGRSIAIVSMSSEPQYRHHFGPLPTGFRLIPYGDASALEAAITPDTAAFLVEPIQGERGIVLPPPGYLAECTRICRDRNVLFIADEVQTGLGRTGKLLACEHEGVHPDGLILGKALGGGLLPVSAFLARADVLGVLKPGDHGSTFGGNPLAAAVALEALEVLVDERLCERSAGLGAELLRELRRIESPLIRDVRGRGLFIGVDLEPSLVTAREAALTFLAHGILTKDTHDTVIRFAPPLTIELDTLDEALGRIRAAFAALDATHARNARRDAPMPA